MNAGCSYVSLVETFVKGIKMGSSSQVVSRVRRFLFNRLARETSSQGCFREMTKGLGEIQATKINGSMSILWRQEYRHTQKSSAQEIFKLT